jgi:hypothetical protein
MATKKKVPPKIGAATKKAEEEQVKALVSMLPKVRVTTRKEDYLASLDDADRRRFLLREYFNKLKRPRAHVDRINERLAWIVASTPFPQLFEYRRGDEELFKECTVVKFNNFRSAHKLYTTLLKFETSRARSLNTAAAYRNPRNEQPS